MPRFPHLLITLAASVLSNSVLAQAPATPSPKPTPPPVLGPGGIKLIPQPGVNIAEADRAELSAGVAKLGAEVESLRGSLKGKASLLALLPDVLIFHKAVDWALRFDEFFDVKQVQIARKQLALGMQRAAELRAGKPLWLSATGLVPRGYISKIDGSVQPYGMVVPEDWKPGEKAGRRLDFWAHGRGEKLSELAFLEERMTKSGEFTPPGAFVLHLYGRFCCANKFAGEVDLFEALENARQHYNIDENKLVMRGFSMGGAAVWQFGTHFAGMFAAVQPGAGFAETREFNNIYAAGKTPPTWWEEVLYRWYDSTDYVANLSNTTTVAYSGEIDGQKQAADIMIRFARKDAGNANPPAAQPGKVNPGDGSAKADEARVTGTAADVGFFHVIGPQTPHKIKAEAKPEIESLLEANFASHQPSPDRIRFTTYSLIYPRLSWVAIDRLEKSWERADVVAGRIGNQVKVTTKNVAALNLGPAFDGMVKIDDQDLQTTLGMGKLGFRKEAGKWLAGEPLSGKSPSVCGPIDHAFMSSFVFVKPTGKPLNEKVGAWAQAELDHALGFWRKVFRGEAPVKEDAAISDDDIKNSNLVLWGDPSSNAVLKKIATKLPLKWDAKNVVFAGQTYDAAHTAPVLIFPNPLNPAKYVVLNSGPTFREEALLNNAQQVPKLPDWAVIDLNTPPDGKWPGAVMNAGFFDEQWRAAAQ